jgi:hypothetical protein
VLARVLALRVFLRLGAFGPVGQSRSVAALIATALPIDIYCHKTGPRAEAGGNGGGSNGHGHARAAQTGPAYFRLRRFSVT